MKALLRLFNTQSGRCEPLLWDPQIPFKTYCCGPTVYGPAHIGNFRTYVIQDTLVRLLKLLQVDYRYVRNLTDVDDKTIRGAREQNQTLKAYTAYWTERFHADCQRLNLLPPTLEPRATQTVEEQLKLIQQLVDTGHAYERAGSVYFRIASFKGYGKLSHLQARELRTQALNSAEQSNDADEYERDRVADFALWKAYKPEDGAVFWESPWGRGRPGWHIECSAMSHHFLGGTLDLHSGGVDLIFPHHENEIAQSESAYPAPFVKHWLHIARLQVEGQKMSKKLGNLLTLDALQERQYAPQAVRYALLSGHYRKPLNFTFSTLNAAQSALHKINAYTQSLCTQLGLNNSDFSKFIEQSTLPESHQWTEAFFEALLQDDLNTPKALGHLFSFMGAHPNPPRNQAKTGILEWAAALYALGIQPTFAAPASIPDAIHRLAEERWACKQAGQFQQADALRQQLLDQGWRVLDEAHAYHLESLP